MTRDKSMFTSLNAKQGGFVTYGDNKKGRNLSAVPLYDDDDARVLNNPLLQAKR